MGCGILAFTIFVYSFTYFHTETILVPRFIIYALFICALLSILRRYKTKTLIMTFILSVMSLLMYFINSSSFIVIFIAQFLYYLQIIFVMLSVVELSRGYDDYQIIKKKVKRYIINTTLLYVFIFYLLLTNQTTTNFLPKLLVYTMIIQSFGLSIRITLLNNYLYNLDEPIKINDINPRTKSKKIIALGILVLSLGTLCVYNDNIPLLVYKKENIQFDCFVYSGRSENIIVDSFRYYVRNNSQYYGDYYRDNQDSPVFYIKEELFKKTHIIEANIYSEAIKNCRIDILVKKGKPIEYIYDNGYVGIIEYNLISPLIIPDELEDCIQIDIRLKDQDDNIIHTESLSLTRQEYKEYGYSDEVIEISNIYATDENIVYGPYIYIKDRDTITSGSDYYIYTTFVVDGKELQYTKSDVSNLVKHLTFKQHLTYAPCKGKTVSLRIHYIEPNVNGKEIFYQDYILEELK